MACSRKFQARAGRLQTHSVMRVKSGIEESHFLRLGASNASFEMGSRGFGRVFLFERVRDAYDLLLMLSILRMDAASFFRE